MTRIQDTCPGCISEVEYCKEHQKAEIEYVRVGDVDPSQDPVFIALKKKYGEL